MQLVSPSTDLALMMSILLNDKEGYATAHNLRFMVKGGAENEVKPLLGSHTTGQVS